MRLNVVRGLFRLWVVLGCLWIILIGAISFIPVRDEFRRATSMRRLDALSWTPDKPVDCSLARGTEFRREGAICWYSLPEFRKLYPEYQDLKENELSEKLYVAAGIPLTPIRPWPLLFEKVALALGPPIVVFVLGWALIWALRGFKSSERAVPAEPPKS